MNGFYEWLYDRYAAPQFDDTNFPEFYQTQKREWEEFSKNLPDRQRLLSVDLLGSLRICWGVQAFTHGVHVGLMLASDLPELESDYPPISPAAQ